MKKLELDAMIVQGGRMICSSAILTGFFGGLLTGAEAGASISVVFGPQSLAAGLVLGGTVGAISGALGGAAAAC